MNPDYAHLLAHHCSLDYRSLGCALKAVIQQRGLTLQQVQDQTRVSRASVSRACAGMAIEIGPLLKLCIWADLNPFELLAPLGTSDAHLFHEMHDVKPFENKRQLQMAVRAAKRARVSHA